MFAIALSGMAGEFRGRRGKDQPSTAGIDGGKAKHVPEKGPVGLGVACVDDGMHACNHGHLHRCGSVARSLVANCGHCANRICFDANSLNSGSGLIGPDPTLTEVTCSRRRSDRMKRAMSAIDAVDGSSNQRERYRPNSSLERVKIGRCGVQPRRWIDCRLGIDRNLPGFGSHGQAPHLQHRIERQVLLGETLHALAKRHDLSRNLIRIWVAKYEAGAFEDDIRAADLLQEYEAKIASGTRGKRYRKVRPACCREIRQPATFEFVLNPHELLGEMLLESDRSSAMRPYVLRVRLRGTDFEFGSEPEQAIAYSKCIREMRQILVEKRRIPVIAADRAILKSLEAAFDFQAADLRHRSLKTM